MRCSRSLLFSGILLLALQALTVIPAFSQDPPDVAMGANPEATYHGGDFDSVDMSTGRLNLRIPLVVDHSQRGKLNFTYSLSFSSTGSWPEVFRNRGWYIQPPKYGISTPALVTDGALGGAFAISYKDDYGKTDKEFFVEEEGYGVGPVHPFAGLSNLAETIDGSGIGINSYTYTNKDGVQFHPGTSIVDPNGNEMVFSGPYGTGSGGSTNLPTTDTLGRAWTYTSGGTNVTGCPAGGPVNPTSSLIWTVPGPSNVSGGVRTFKLCYSTYTISSSFNNGFAVDYLNGTAMLLTGLVLPDGTTWRFDYDKNLSTHFGDLTDIYTPTGGHFTYAWTTAPPQVVCETYGAAYRVIRSRTVNDGVTSNTWNYAIDVNGVNTVTDPLGNDTVYTPWVCSGVTPQIQYYAGSSTNGGTLLKTVNSTYKSLPNPFIVDTASDGYNPLLLASTTTKWANGQVSQVQYTYDSGFTFVDNNGDADPYGAQYTSSYGLVLSETHTDYGSGAPGPTLSVTNKNYKALTTSSYATANILDLPISVVVTDGSTPAKVCAETDYGYDESAADSSGVTEQHTSAPNSVRGNLTSIKRQLFTGPCSTSTPSETPLTTTNHIYDTGMIHTSTDPNQNTTTYGYSGSFYGAYVTQTTFPPTASPNPANHIISGNYDFDSGLLTCLTDQNGNTSSYIYDVLLRVTIVSYSPASSPCSGSQNGQTIFNYPNTTTVEMKKQIDSTRWTDSFVYYDGLGRECRRTSVNDEPNPYDEVDTVYDAAGRVHFKSYPYPGPGTPPSGACSSSQPGDTFAYDPLNRVTQVTHSDNSTILTSYTGRATSVQDEGNGGARVQRISQVDGLGRLASLCEISGSLTVGISGSQSASPCNLDIGGTGFLTTYTYDPLSNLKSVSQGPLNARIFTYDSLSRLTIATNPESGTICYGTVSGGTCQQNGYDGNGNLLYKTDARGVLTSYHYDALNREYQTRNYSDSTPTLYFSYDVAPSWIPNLTNVIGRLVEANNQYAGSSGSTQAAAFVNSYDVMGRVNFQWQQTPSSSPGGFSMVFTYDLGGDLTSSTNGLGFTLNYSVNRAQRLTTLTNNATAFGPAGSVFGSTTSPVHYNAAGSVVSASLGNGISETRSYDARLRLTGITDGSVYSVTIPTSGGYAPNSDILLANDSVNGNWTYAYDAFNRLASANATGQPYTYAYDRFGNRWQQNGPHSSNPGFDANNHMVPGLGVTYDAAGNETSDGLTTYTYDAENRISTATNPTTGTSSYVYDATGKRIRKTSVAGGAVDFLYDLAGNEIAQVSSTGSWTRGEIYAAGRHVATLNNNTTYYNHSDWLGTERARSTSTGTLLETCTSLPFGDWLTCGGNDPSPMHFTGKERDTETGLDAFGARYNSSQYGRFMTPDWSTKTTPVPYADLADPRSLNLYTYVRNNPLSRADVDGHCDAPSGLKRGQVGVCVASYIKTTFFKVVGRGDGRGTDGNGGSARIETLLVVDPKTGKVTNQGDSLGRSGILVKDLGPKGTGHSENTQGSVDAQGNTHFQISQDAHSFFSADGILLGSIDNHINLSVTPDQKVGIDPGSTAKDFPSLEIYRYTTDGTTITTTLITNRQEIGNGSALKQPETPLPSQAPQ